MSDEMIIGMLIERKRQERRRKAIKEAVGGILGWVLLLGGLFSLSVLAYAFA